MKIDLLYFDDCPSWQQGLENLQAALAAENIQAEISPVKVEDNVQAARLKFLGSPSFHIDGADLWAEERTNYALSCRVYSTPQGIKGAPTVEMLRQKLIMIIKSQEDHKPTTPKRPNTYTLEDHSLV